MSAKRGMVAIAGALATVVAAGTVGSAPSVAGAAPADLVVGLDAPASVEVGTDVAYGVEVGNRGPDPAEDVELTDALPDGFVFSSAAASAGTCTEGTTVTCDLGTIAAGDSVAVTIVATPTAPGSATNAAAATSSTPEAVPTDNEATATTEVTDLSCGVVGRPQDETLPETAGGSDCETGGDGRTETAAGEDEERERESDRCVEDEWTRCDSPPIWDPGDTRGPMDVRLVRLRRGRVGRIWRVGMRAPFRIPRMRDEGFVLLSLDTRWGPAPEYYAFARSTGKKVVGRLFRARKRRERRLGPLRARMAGPRTIAIVVPLYRLRFGPERDFLRWQVTTIFDGRPCARVCLDHVPNPKQAFVEPRR